MARTVLIILIALVACIAGKFINYKSRHNSVNEIRGRSLVYNLMNKCAAIFQLLLTQLIFIKNM